MFVYIWFAVKGTSMHINPLSGPKSDVTQSFTLVPQITEGPHNSSAIKLKKKEEMNGLTV